jgi:thiol:disulfide interchange protein
MNGVGKLISVVIYAAALYLTHQIAPGATVAVAIIGIVLFFGVHIALRSKQGSAK